MVKKALLVACAIFIGCALKQPTMIEGTSLRLGCYIPWSGELYGLELMSFMTGTMVSTPTNSFPSIEHSSTSTNSWCWGMLKSVEHSDTKVKLK